MSLSTTADQEGRVSRVEQLRVIRIDAISIALVELLNSIGTYGLQNEICNEWKLKKKMS